MFLRQLSMSRHVSRWSAILRVSIRYVQILHWPSLQFLEASMTRNSERDL
jgi:hypothetical protein